MEEQYFSSTHSTALFDLNAPMGFSPSIDASNALPMSFGDGFEAPSFMVEVQRQRADTMTTLKPDFEFKQSLDLDDDSIEVDIPPRKRALQRLSLASSIASSAASTSTSDADFNGFDSESSASPPHLDYSASDCGLSDMANTMTTVDRMPDLVNWRSSTTMHASFALDALSPSSNMAQGSEFSFAEFIDENAQEEATVDAVRPAMSSSDSSGSLSTGASSADSDAAPTTPVSTCGAEFTDELSSKMTLDNGSDGLGLFSIHTPDHPTMAHGEPMAMPSFTHMPAQPNFAEAHHQQPMAMATAWPIPRPMGSIDVAAPMHVGQDPFAAHAMVFSQSAPVHGGVHMAMFAPGVCDSPVPSSPAFSARSSSPFGASFSASPLMRSPATNQMPLHQIHMGGTPNGDSPMPKGMNLLGQYAHLANPYAGLITKRSRGRRVPSKPEEMNNLGKSGKVYTCKVPGCGKCFKRSEHLKRHVRSIHTDEKPFMCPFPGCHKRFSRHDNLNQHARVHSTGTPTRAAGQAATHDDGMPALSQPNFGGSDAGEGNTNSHDFAPVEMKAESA